MVSTEDLCRCSHARRLTLREEVARHHSINPRLARPHTHGKPRNMQSVHSLFLRRSPIWKKPAPPPGVPASTWLTASRASQWILCLRPACRLSADNADALVAAVGARVRAAVPSPCSVVLD